MKMLIDISEDVKAVIDRNGTNEYVIDAVWEAVHNAIPYDMLDDYLKRISQVYNDMYQPMLDNLTDQKAFRAGVRYVVDKLRGRLYYVPEAWIKRQKPDVKMYFDIVERALDECAENAQIGGEE